MKKNKKLMLVSLLLSIIPIEIAAQPTITEYAQCAGTLVVAVSLLQDNDPDKSVQVMKDAKSLEYKASKMKGYSKGIFKEISFNSTGDYVAMIKRENISDIDLWSDIGYCRGLAQ
jgi:hypothetical protein